MEIEVKDSKRQADDALKMHQKVREQLELLRVKLEEKALQLEESQPQVIPLGGETAATNIKGGKEKKKKLTRKGKRERRHQ